eukprot:3840491-Rhodomonas_salina.2
MLVSALGLFDSFLSLHTLEVLISTRVSDSVESLRPIEEFPPLRICMLSEPGDGVLPFQSDFPVTNQEITQGQEKLLDRGVQTQAQQRARTVWRTRAVWEGKGSTKHCSGKVVQACPRRANGTWKTICRGRGAAKRGDRGRGRGRLCSTDRPSLDVTRQLHAQIVHLR